MVARDELAFLFWGDKSDEIARKNLREAISRLKRALPNPNWVLIQPDLVGLDFGSISVDLHEFNNLIDEALSLAYRISNDQPLPQPIYQKLIKALSLWRSPRCMAGTVLAGTPEIEQWFLDKASSTEHAHLNVLERIAFHALASTNLDECLYYARQGLAIDNTHEGFQYIILRALVNLGRSGQAREYYQLHIQPLEAEGYFFSDPRLKEVIQQINDQKPAESSRITQPRWDLHESLKVPFVGRQALLDQLWNQFFKGGGALILGETGQGKTRLLEQFISQAAPSARILTATCHLNDKQLALQPFIDLFRNHFEERDWLAVPALWAAQLAPIFPELQDLRPDLLQTYGGLVHKKATPSIQSSLFEALRQAFWAIAQQERLLICIDGLQWADGASLAALAYLVERPPFTEHGFIVMSVRTADRLSNTDQIEQILRRSSNGTVLEMKGLTLDETSVLIGYLLTGTPAEAWIQKIHADSGGNPLYTLEIIRTMLEEGIDLIHGHGEAIPTPNKIAQLIRQRLEDLTPPERTLLEIAAIYGTEFDPAMVHFASEFSFDEFAINFEQLLARQIIEPLPENTQELQYRFIHSRIREVILDEIPDLRRRWLHRKAAQALSKHSALPYNHPAILAEHYEKSNDPEMAFQFWALAAQQARRVHSVDVALRHFTNAEQQLHLATGLTTRQIYEFYTEWSKMAFDVEQLELIKQNSQTLLQIGYERRSDLLIGAAHDVLSDAYMLESKYQAALESNLHAEKFLEQTGYTLAIAQMYNRRGFYHILLNQFSEAEKALHSALQQPGDEKDPFYLRSLADTHIQLALLWMLSGWPVKSLHHAQDAQKYYEAVRDPYGKVGVFNSLAIANYFSGNYQSGRQYCEVGIELAEKIQAWKYLGNIYGHAAKIDLATGNIDSALSNARQAIQVGHEWGHTELVAIGKYTIGSVFLWFLDHQEALEYYQAGYDINQNPFLTNNLLFRVSLAQSLTGNTQAGLETLDQVIQSTTLQQKGLDALQSRLSKVWILYEKERYEGLAEMAAEIAEEAKQRGLKFIQLSSEMIIHLLNIRSNGAKAIYRAVEGYLQDLKTLSHPLLELIFVLQLNRVDGSKRSDFPIDQARVNQLLDQLEVNAQDPLIHSTFLNFRNGITFREFLA